MMNNDDLVTLGIDEIHPYEKNPRRIPEHAVKAVADSLERFGYQQPIVVDENHVVIVGHTRLQAMKRLGVERVQVHVARGLSPEKVREYRLLDNRAGELSEWEHEKLVMELREFDESLLESYFPEVDLEIETLEAAQVTEKDIERGAAQAAAVKQQDEASGLMTNVECPSCHQHFPVATASLPTITAADLRVLAEQE